MKPPPAIQQSTDYTRFIPHGKQKVMKPLHVRRLTDSMRVNGFMPSNPMIVFEEGGKYRIVVGHNRFAAARALKIPVLFMVFTKTVAEKMLYPSNIQMADTTSDLARGRALDGIPAYVTLAKYQKLGIPFKCAASLLWGQSSGSGNANRAIQENVFTVRDTTQIDLIVSLIHEFGETHPGIRTRHFMDAFSLCYYVPEFEVRQLRARLAANPKFLQPAANRKQMMEQIQELYNLKSRSVVDLVIRATTAAKQRSAVHFPKAA